MKTIRFVLMAFIIGFSGLQAMEKEQQAAQAVKLYIKNNTADSFEVKCAKAGDPEAYPFLRFMILPGEEKEISNISDVIDIKFAARGSNNKFLNFANCMNYKALLDRFAFYKSASFNSPKIYSFQFLIKLRNSAFSPFEILLQERKV